MINPGSALKIAYLYQTPAPRLDGDRAAAVHINQVVCHLKRRGHHVRLFTLQGRYPVYTDDPQALWANKTNGFHYGQLGVSGTRPFLWLESALRRLQTELQLPYLGLFDSLHFHEACLRELCGYDLLYERYNLFARGGVWTAQRTGIPLVIEVNGDMIAEYDYVGRPLRGLQRWMAVWSTHFVFATARAIVSPSQGLADHLVARWGLPQDKVFVIPNAADIETFGTPSDPEVWRTRLGIPDDALVVMFVGGFYPWHGLETLVEAFVRVRDQVPTAHLVLVGDGAVRPTVEARIGSLSLNDAAIVTGNVPHPDVADLLALADVTTATLQEKGWGVAPLKLFEYMAAGKAIVASAVAGIDEFILDNETGILVPPEDVEALAQALIHLLRNPAERARLGRNARRQAVEQHSWERYVERLAEIYADVLAQKR